MDSQAILSAAAAIDKFPLPAAVAATERALYLLAESDIVPRKMPTAQELGTTVFALTVPAGQVPDVLQLVRQAREGADAGVAFQAIEAAKEVGEHRLESAVQTAVPAMLATVRTRIEALYVEVRRLPSSTPVSAEAAVRGSTEQLEAFRTLEQLVTVHGQLRRLHLTLISPLEPELARVFVDTRLLPSMLDGKVYQSAGQPSPAARLLWLATPASQSWVPSSADATAQYSKWRLEASQPDKSPVPAQRLR